MATTSIIVNSADNGKLLQKTITNVNPDADNAKLAQWGQMLTGLTENTYTKTDRVDKANCDTEVDTRQTPTFTINGQTEKTINKQGASESPLSTLVYTGDATSYTVASNVKDSGFGIVLTSQYIVLVKYGNDLKDVTFTITFDGTDNYKPASVTYIIKG